MSVVELCLLCEESCVCFVSRCVTRVILGFTVTVIIPFSS